MSDTPAPESQAPAPDPQAPAIDVQAEIAKALAAQQTAFTQQLKAATGHDSVEALNEAKLKEQGKFEELTAAAKTEAAHYKAKFESTAITNALLSASTEALDPDIVTDLFAGKAVVDDKGAVTIDGKPVATVVADFLKAKPHLAKPIGTQGSGASSSGSPADTDEAAKTAYATAAKSGDVLTMLALNTGAKS